MGKILRNVLLIGGSLATIGVVFVLWSNGVFHTSEHHFDGRCEALSATSNSGPGLVGVEDIVIDHERAVAYLSATDRRDPANPRGAIYLLPLYLDDGPIHLTDLTQGEPVDFHPHGIDLHISPDGTRRLFVVSHDKGRREDGGAHILTYRLGETGYLELEESVADDAVMPHPNDVAALGPREFFATNDMSAPSKTFREMFDIALHLKTGHLVHSKDGVVKIADIGRFAMPNGVTYDAASNALYVSETMNKKIHAYRVTETGGLIPLDRATSPSFGDNMSIADNGDLYLAGHLSMLSFLGHMNDPRKTSPSDILRFDASDRGDALAGRPERIMITDGRAQFGAKGGLSGISTAAAHRDILLIGSVFEPRIWRCMMEAL